MTADQKYEAAMAESEALLSRMAEASNSSDPVRAMLADIWAQRHNAPYITTVFEATAEMNSPIKQVPGG